MRLPLLTAFAVTLLACCALWWPVPAHLGTWHVLTAFGDSHVWVFDFLARGLPALPGTTTEVGFPEARTVRLIGWAPGLVAVGLRPLFGPLGAANVVQLCSLPVGAVVAAVLVRRWSGASPWAAAALGVTWALCPTLLGTFGTGEISNTQAWVLPLFLLAFERALERPGASLGVAAVGLVAAFSSPYYALAMPVLAVPWALAHLRRRRLTPLLALTALALSLLPARMYYEPGESGGAGSIFQPARRYVAGQTVPHPPPVADPMELIAGTVRAAGSPWESAHISYVGVPLLLAAALALGRRRERTGLALAGGGLLLALGPWLNFGGHYARLSGALVPLPARLLELLHYPTEIGGLYFRYTVILSLGLVLVVGTACRARAAPAWLLLALQLAFAVRDTGPLWPRPAEPVPDLAVLRQMRDDAAPGAVLDLPLQGPADAWFGQGALLRAVFHRRPTTALPRDVHRAEPAVLRALAAVKGEPEQASSALKAAGFRYVVVVEALARFSDPSVEQLDAALGAPDHIGSLRVWRLDP